VIELRFAEPIPTSAIEGVSADFHLDYPLQHTIRNVGVTVGMPVGLQDRPTAAIQQEEIGHRRGSSDLTQLMLLWPSQFVISQLAPYPGWDGFFGRFVRDWPTFKKATGYRKIVRIGVRYINRLDIRIVDKLIEESEYLNLYPKLPASFGPFTAYGLQAQFPPDEADCSLTVNSSCVPSPLLNHGSFLIDLDFSRERNPPQNDEAIYNLLNQIRAKKNAAFEACITDKARELFRA
jgi:uncharacterized protein (TIGR04255 family)